MKRTEKTPVDQHQKLEENDGDEEDTGGGLATFVQTAAAAAAAAQGAAAPPGGDTTTPFTLAKETTADIEQIEAVPRVNVNSTIIVPGAVHVRGFDHISSSEEDSPEGEEIQGATTRGGAHGRSESQLLAEETSLPRRTATPMLVAHLVDDDEESRGRRNAASQQEVSIPMVVAEELQTTSNKCLYWMLLLLCLMLVAAATAIAIPLIFALAPSSSAVQSFQQEFLIPQETLFNKPEQMHIATLFASYTGRYSDAEVTQRITTTCEFTDQNTFACELGCIFGQPNDGFVLVADYFCNWASWASWDHPVNDLPEKYTTYMNQNRSGVLYDMQSSDLEVTEVGFVRRPTPAPTMSPILAPTTINPTSTLRQEVPEPRLSTAAISAIVVVCVAFLMAMVLFYRHQRKKRQQEASQLRRSSGGE